jgi:uncharacterized protein (TIGR02246 family)
MNTKTKTDEGAIRDVVAGMSAAWEAGDGAAFAEFYAEDADQTVWSGRYIKGRDDIREGHQQIFDSIYKDTRMDKKIKAIRFITDDVCLVHLESTIVGPESSLGSGMQSRPLLVLKRQADGRWLIEALQNTPVVKDGVVQGLRTPGPSDQS